MPKHETKARFRVSAGVVRLLRPAPYITPSTRPKQHASQRSRLRPVIWTLASLPEILASCSRTYGCIEPAIQQRTTSLDAEKRDISTREGPGAKGAFLYSRYQEVSPPEEKCNIEQNNVV